MSRLPARPNYNPPASSGQPQVNNRSQEELDIITATVTSRFEEQTRALNQANDSLNVALAVSNSKFDHCAELLMHTQADLQREGMKASSMEAEYFKLLDIMEDERNKNRQLDSMLYEEQQLNISLSKKVDSYIHRPQSASVGEYQNLVNTLEAEKLKFDDVFQSCELEISSLKKQLDSVHILGSVADPSDLYLKNTFGKLPLPKVGGGYDPDLFKIFNNSTINCKLDCFQLQTATSKGDWPLLSIKTCFNLIRHFDTDFCSFEDFPSVWQFLEECKVVFENHEMKKPWSFISSDSLILALSELKCRITKKALAITLKRLGLEGENLGWDAFVRLGSCLIIWLLEFKKLDFDEDDAITVLIDQYMLNLARCIP